MTGLSWSLVILTGRAAPGNEGINSTARQVWSCLAAAPRPALQFSQLDQRIQILAGIGEPLGNDGLGGLDILIRSASNHAADIGQILHPSGIELEQHQPPEREHGIL